MTKSGRRRRDSLVVVVNDGLVTVLDGSDAQRAVAILGTAFEGEPVAQVELGAAKTRSGRRIRD